MALLSAAVGAAIGFIQAGENRDFFQIEIWALGSVCWVVLTYCVAEIFLLCRFAKACDEKIFAVPERDVVNEKRIFKRAVQIGVPIYCTAVILVLILIG